MTIYASRGRWTPRKLAAISREHAVHLSDRGEAILNGEIVATFELAGGALVFHDLDPGSPLIALFELRLVE